MRRAILAVLGTVAGLVGLLSFKTHAAPVPAAPAAVGTVGPGTTSGAGPSATTGSGTTRTGAAKTVTGASVDTRWGPVQVRITVSGGKLTGVDAIVYPTENPRDQEINSRAIPQLNREALAAGSAKIDMVSGATYTSDGYVRSLQSALDTAGL